MSETTARACAWASKWKFRAVAAVLLGTLAAGAGAGEAGAATLRWKFKAGDKLHYAMDQTTVTQLKANGQDIKTTNKQTIDMTWAIDSVADDGTAEITQTIDRMRTKIDSAFGAFEFDSKSDKAPEGPIAAGVVPTLKLLVGATFKYKMTPRGELKDVRVPEGLVKSLKESSPAAAAAAGGMFTEEGLKNMINESSLNLPEEDLTKGKSWTRPTKMPPSPIGVMTLDKTYTYEGLADGNEKLALNVVVKLEPAANPAIEVKIGEQKGEGTFLFDNNAGRVSSSKVTEKISVAIKVMNQTIDQTTETTSEMKLTDGK